jgi:pimeloyl-ACP methyl ester carboxylesterase
MAEFTSDDGIRLHYVTQGTGALPIIYLHWMGGSGLDWKRFWTSLDQRRYRHVALDFRGHGQSDPTPSSFTNERLARDVLQLADELGLPHFVVAGHSFGGKVALKLAAMGPARVAGLMLRPRVRIS